MTAAHELTLREVYAARRRLRPFLSPTPLQRSEWLSDLTGADVSVKAESLQPTHSFKIRGALNALLCATEKGATASRKIVTASAGNHGQAIALAAARLGLRAVVFTPATAPATKKAAILRHGAQLRDDCPDYDAAERDARDYAASQQAIYLSPYNHVDVIAGAATVALEIIETRPDIDVVVVPLGGGGLASGVGLVVKAATPGAGVIGVEVAASTPFAASLAHGAIVRISPRPSLADGLTGNLEPDSMTFEMVRRLVDRVVNVDETTLAQAIRGLAAEDGLIAEGAGATAVAALLGRQAVEPGQRAVVLLTGGNIDWETFISAVATGVSRPGSAGCAQDGPADRQ